MGAKSSKYLLDSSFIVSVLLPQDANHQIALSITEKISGNIYISNYVLQETVSVLSRKTNSEYATTWYKEFLSQPKVTVLYADYKIDLFTITLIDEDLSRNISFIDYSNIIFMKEYEINKLIAFDNHFKELQKYYDFQIIS